MKFTPVRKLLCATQIPTQLNDKTVCQKIFQLLKLIISIKSFTIESLLHTSLGLSSVKSHNFPPYSLNLLGMKKE